jgi:hypothetical protein
MGQGFVEGRFSGFQENGGLAEVRVCKMRARGEEQETSLQACAFDVATEPEPR